MTLKIPEWKYYFHASEIANQSEIAIILHTKIKEQVQSWCSNEKKRKIKKTETKEKREKARPIWL